MGMLGNHEARVVSGKLFMSQNNHTLSILTGCAGDESRWRKRKAVEENQKAVEESGKPLKKAVEENQKAVEEKRKAVEENRKAVEDFDTCFPYATGSMCAHGFGLVKSSTHNLK